MLLNLKNKFKKFNDINNMAFFLICNSMTALMIGLVDQAMVGRISIFAYGAVGIVSLTLYSISGILGMIAVSFNILGSNSKGLKNDDELFNKFRITIVLNVFIGLIFYVLILIFKVPMLKIFFGLKGNILNEAVNYLNIFSISVGLNLILFVFSALFKILKQTKWIFYGAIVANISNLILDYIFIFGKLGFPRMGVTGAAIASVTALCINIIIFIYALKNTGILKLKINNCKVYIKQLIKISIPLMGQEFLEGTLFNISIIAIVSRIGVLEVAAYTLLFNIVNILLMPMYAYSSTSLNFVSELYVNKFQNNIKKIPIMCLKMSFLYYIFISIVCIVFKTTLLGLMTNEITVINFSAAYLVFAIFVQSFNFPHSIYKYSLQGISEERWVFKISLIINLISMAIIVCLVFIFKISFLGVYIGIGINYFLLSLLFYNKFIKTINANLS